jgi:hypothetical protein
MGMTCSLHRVTTAEIDELIRNPDAMARLLGVDEGPRVREVKPRGLLGLLLRLTPITITEVDPDAPGGSADASGLDPEKSIDVGKAWHGLHFLFTGTADEGEEPACYMVKGGENLDDDGLARALRPPDVKQFAHVLTSLTDADLERRYDPKRMTALGIYPGVIWNRTPPDDDPRQWLLDSFRELRAFVQRVADAGGGLVIHIS